MFLIISSIVVNLNALSGEKIFYDNPSQNYYNPVVISINKELNIFVTWRGFNADIYGYGNTLYGLLYDQTGKIISPKMKIGSYESNYYSYSGNLDNYLTDAGDFIVAWADNTYLYTWRTYTVDRQYTFRKSVELGWIDYAPIVDIVHSENHKNFMTYAYGSVMYGLYMNDNGHLIQSYILGYNETSAISDRSFYNTAIYNDEIFITYESNKHAGSGIDIWGNVQSLKDIDFEPERFRPPVTDDILYPNFPNPFNGTTTISYELLAYHKVKLAVYDVLGREVRVLVDRNQEKGYYEVEFNATGLASGIYFCRLQAFRTQIRKMVVIK